ncbi:unnamed protein product [Adineta steineri]|uniref:Uncharacterized protein n=1 Tax=Adineta steineri TaxID=433720 RepID=A0A813W4Z4_9BILA|nr:unnamed protein product [Adineta steineri]CAF3839959.1 unnamed protein product [Adineta steineri]
MKRNGLVFVPREPPKRVILYPGQDSASQQQALNGFYTRAKTELIINNQNGTISQSTNNNNTIRLSRQQLLSSAVNGSFRTTEKSNNDASVSASTSAHSATSSAAQKVQNPYYTNPFFRPRIITKQQQPTTTTNTSILPPSSSPVPSTTNTDVTVQTIIPPSTTMTYRGKQPLNPRIKSPLLFSNGKSQDSNKTIITSLAQDDNRHWAHSVTSTQVVESITDNEHSIGPLKALETTATNNDTSKQKGSSSTDITISLLGASYTSNHSGSVPAIDLLTRNSSLRDDSTVSNQTLIANEQSSNIPPLSSADITSAANNNNQNWKKTLAANFQKNYRNTPTARLLYNKQPSSSSSSDIIPQQQQQQQQQKSERTITLSAINNDCIVPNSENSSVVSSGSRKSTESLLNPKLDNNNNNNNTERSGSLQMQKSTYSNPTVTKNTSEEKITPIEISNHNHMPHLPISIPSALFPIKPTTTNIEQQRANITRVMIRRDFVKPLESKPPMPTTTNMRSLMVSQSAKPDSLSTNNVIRVATITENTNRTYLSQQQQHQQQQASLLSQKSLLLFASTNSTVKEPIKGDNNQQRFNGMNSLSPTRIKQSQIETTNSVTTNIESRRKREETNNKTQRRAVSASAASSYE